MDTLNLPLHRDQFPLKKTWNLAKYLLHNKGMTEPQKMVGEAEKWSFQKNYPWHWWSTSGQDLTFTEIYSKWQKVCTLYQAHKPLGPAKERQVTKVYGFENLWDLYPGEPKSMGRGKPALRELMHRLTPRTQHKASVCKVPRPYVKELH